jgi:DNA repair exonuclease SbcCD ATPase subunit
MRQALPTMSQDFNDFSGLEDYIENAKESLDTIGTVNFGDGKFLQHAYQSEMRGIQGGCLRINKEFEQIEKAYSSNTKLNNLRKNLKTYEAYINLEKEEAELKESLKDLEKKEKKLEKEIETANSEMADSKDDELELEIKSIHEKISKTLEAEKNLQKTVFSLLSPLKSYLRKYSKVAANKTYAKLAAKLETEPVKTFLDSSDDELKEFLNAFEQSLERGSFKVKDMDKAKIKIEKAVEGLSLVDRSRFIELKQEIQLMRSNLEKLEEISPSASLDKRLKSLNDTLRECIENRKIMMARQKQLQKDILEHIEKLKSSADDVGLSLDVQDHLS